MSQLEYLEYLRRRLEDAWQDTGTTCVAAKRMGLRWIAIDGVPKYADLARLNVEQAAIDGGPDLRVGFLKWPKVVEEAMPRRLRSIGREAGEAKHKRQVYGVA